MESGSCCHLLGVVLRRRRRRQFWRPVLLSESIWSGSNGEVGTNRQMPAHPSTACKQACSPPISKQEKWDGWYFSWSPRTGTSVLHEIPRTTQSGYSGKHSWDLIILDGPVSLNYSILPYSPLKAVRLSPWVITKAGTMLY